MFNLQLNVYTAAISSVNKIVINEWLRLNFIGFLMLRHFLKQGAWVEVDDGYVGHLDKVKCPVNSANPPENLAMQGRVWLHHEMLNGWLKNWGILSQVYHHDILYHGDVFRACTVLTQLAINDGEKLFEVADY